ncbi:Threonine dehydrogenase [Microbacterium sp. cf046]|uniref:alcohol dehydrogenase catalytic domain-containing protein n=1 Tax=Microbacterium sp. cf046 TaxID=1761803 RepID=UPI0008E3A714|nr:alcohol dehydrogenase catalytic domain-containing protein [Microbacterium sp. cf046]SFS16736.1 Threonine dehydrogenase [Microbacterium sp. cf046]
MRATLIYEAGDVHVADVPDPSLHEPTDAIVSITASCICGSDLHPYRSKDASSGVARIGHEFIGIVEAVGRDVTTVSQGDLVVAPFAYSDGTCEFCRSGLYTSCVRGGFWARGGVDGGQGEAVRVPFADGTLVKLDVEPDDELIPSLLTLSDVLGTGHYAAVRGGVREGSTVTVIGDGAVGLLAVLAAKRIGAEQIVLMGRHQSRTSLGVEFGATDVVTERGVEGVQRVLELTRGGSQIVIEAVGHLPAYEQAYGVVRPGGVISRVGAPQYDHASIGFPSLFGKNATLTGGPAPVRAYIEELLPDILEGRIHPGRVFDRTLPLESVAEGYRSMDARESLKVLLTV